MSHKMMEELCKAYLEAVSQIDIVQQVGITKIGENTTIWVMITAFPFNDSLRMPIYDAQLRILRQATNDIRLDFRVLNTTELHGIENLTDIFPQCMKLLWSRQGDIAQKSHNVL